MLEKYFKENIWVKIVQGNTEIVDKGWTQNKTNPILLKLLRAYRLEYIKSGMATVQCEMILCSSLSIQGL